MGATTQLDSKIRSLPLAVLTPIADNFPHPTSHQNARPQTADSLTTLARAPYSSVREAEKRPASDPVKDCHHEKQCSS